MGRPAVSAEHSFRIGREAAIADASVPSFVSTVFFASFNFLPLYLQRPSVPEGSG